MIERLTVRDFILVSSLTIEFTEGFNVLTGETGAGKSILVGALSMLFGAKGGGDLVRTGAEEALVSGEYRVADHPECLRWLDERGIQPEDGVILVRRTIRPVGRGTISMQSTPVTRADLEEFSGFLLDLHSQHEHQSLFVETNHRRILDRFAGIEEDVSAFSQTFAELGARQEERRTLAEREADRVREAEMLSFAVDEIAAAEISDGEYGRLEQERDRLNAFERLAAHVEAASQLLDGDEQAAVPLLKRARQEYAGISRIDTAESGTAERLNAAYFELEDIAHTLAGYRDGLAFDPRRLEELEERMATLKRLFRKYGDGEAAVRAYADEAASRLEVLQNAGETSERLVEEIGRLEKEIARRARELHTARRAAADQLQDRISGVLADLSMGQAVFQVDIATRTGDAGRLVCGPQGADRVRFLISTNPGEEPRQLARIASGGEISRVMLAIKTVIAEVDDVRSLVFDEIDSGVGGQVALSIAAHLAELSRHAQVIAITHLATIAVRADNHIVVEKRADTNRTRVSVRPVTGDEREREIARMLAGDTEERHSVDHARALLDRYQREDDG